MAPKRRRTTAGQAAEALVGSRVDFVDEAQRAADEVARIEAENAERLETARRSYADAYAAATDPDRGGWTRADLTRFGLTAPDGARKRRVPKQRGDAAPGPSATKAGKEPEPAETTSAEAVRPPATAAASKVT